jgi:pSer/pThr/pTyr-binding forkhead associated (FHA) protein
LNEEGAIAQQWEIGNHPVAIGRDESADVLIPDDTLSRRHFLIWREGESFLVKDLGSQNGTWVDGQRAQGTKLTHNVCIVAGRTVFMFCEGGFHVAPAHAAAAASPKSGIVLPAALAKQTAGVFTHATSMPAEQN